MSFFICTIFGHRFDTIIHRLAYGKIQVRRCMRCGDEHIDFEEV